MALYADLKDSVDDVVFANGVSSITGTNMQTKLFEMIDGLGEHKFQGVATPATDPGNPDGKVWYFANEAAAYPNFSGLVVAPNNLSILRGSGTTWSQFVVFDYTALAALGAAGGEIKGVATTTTDPGTPTETEYWFASQAGSYTNFGLSVTAGELCLFKWDTGGGSWVNYILYYNPVSTGGSEGSSDGSVRRKIGFYYTTGGARISLNTGIGLSSLFRGYYRWSGGNQAFRIERDTNSIKVNIPEGVELYHLFFKDGVDLYPDGYVTIEFFWEGAVDYNEEIRDYLIPTMNVIYMTDSQPSGGNPDMYVDGNNISSIVEIVAAENNSLILKVNQIDTFYAIGFSFNF